MPRDFRCAGYPTPAAHVARSAEAGFQNIVVTRGDLTGTTVPDPDGRLCGACQAAKQVDDSGAGNNRRALIASIRSKLRANPVPGFTPAETALIMLALFRDEDN